MRTKGEGRASGEKGGRLLQGNAVPTLADKAAERAAEEAEWASKCGPVEVTRRCIPERDVHVEPHVGCILR